MKLWHAKNNGVPKNKGILRQTHAENHGNIMQEHFSNPDMQESNPQKKNGVIT